jgi:hypothetical protein
MATNSPVDVPITTAKDAVAHHMRWRITLQLAVTMREPLGPHATSAIEHLEECSIGKWLISRHTINIRDTQEYRDLVECHEEFHRVMTAIAFSINHGEYEAAGQALAPDSSFRVAAHAISSAMMALDRIQTIAIAG